MFVFNLPTYDMNDVLAFEQRTDRPNIDDSGSSELTEREFEEEERQAGKHHHDAVGDQKRSCVTRSVHNGNFHS